MMKPKHADDIQIIIPEAALLEIFDECDRYQFDETGGRIVGAYHRHSDELTIEVQGIIEPGSKARRSPTVLWQDGEYQENVFRQIEEDYPSVEHLGTWHTHHVNGLQTLSGGDITTYTKTVNHPKHNTDFFYALLVVNKEGSDDPLGRYSFKHFLFKRGDRHFYEIPASCTKIVNSPLVWPRHAKAAQPAVQQRHAAASYGRIHQLKEPAAETGINRVYDRDIIGQFYEAVKPYSSPKLGVYWRGPLPCLDGSSVEVVVVEDASHGHANYSLHLRNAPDSLAKVAAHLAKKEFRSARAALITAERECNVALFEHSQKNKEF